MEKWFRFGLNAEKIPGYNCGGSTEDWHAKGLVNNLLGTSFIAFGISVQILYAFILCSIWRLKKTNSCYKIMFLLGIFDILNLTVNADITGYFWLVGANYCTHPNFNYITGCAGVAVWGGSCFCCLIMVINRVVDLWNPHFNDKLFGGYRMYLWLSTSILYALYFFFFTLPVLFNSKLTSWFFSPIILGTAQEMAEFHSLPHTLNNLGVVAITFLLYIILIIIIKYRYRIEAAVISQAQRSIMIQCILICSASFVGSIIYVYMQFFPIPTWIILVGHLCWQASQGGTN